VLMFDAILILHLNLTEPGIAADLIASSSLAALSAEC
jgi:hypothetical protein